MVKRFAIVGAGYTSLRAVSPEASYRELVFEAAVRAYQDAGITNDDIGSVVALGEDYREGTAIADEYVPDQLGAVQKPVHTVSGDGLQALGVGGMLLATGAFDVVVLEGHSKASNMLYPGHIEAMALDPVYVRPHGWHPHFVAGLEMRRFLHDTGIDRNHLAGVSVKNKRNALHNPIAAYPCEVSIEQVLASRAVAEPLTELAVAAPADGAFVFVLAPESNASRFKNQPVFVDAVSWIGDSCNLFTRDWGGAVYAEEAARRAYNDAGIKKPTDEFDFAEIDDSFTYKELQHAEAIGVAPKGESGRMLQRGDFDPGGKIPVNVSGGSLGCGHMHDASSLRGVMEAVWQLRGHAGERQVADAKRGVVCSWRGVPTATGGVAVLSRR